MFNNIKNFLSDRFGYISKPKLFILCIGFFCIVFAIFKINSSTKPNNIEQIKSQIINIDAINVADNVSNNLNESPADGVNETAQLPESSLIGENITNEKSNENNIANLPPKKPAKNLGHYKIEEVKTNKEPKKIIPDPAIATKKIETKSTNLEEGESGEALPPKASREMLNKIVEGRIKEGLKKSKSSRGSAYNGSEVVSKNGKYKLQLLAYSTAGQAKNYAIKIKNKSAFKNYQIFVAQKKVKNKKFYAVQIGLFKSKSLALKFCTKIKQNKTVSSCFVVGA